MNNRTDFAPRPRRFTPTAFLLVSGLLIWMTNFLFVYVFAALACARSFGHVQVAGWPIVPLVNTLSTLLALGATLLLMRKVAQHHPAADAPARFARFVTLAICGLSLVSLVWLALPSITVSVCDSGQ